MLRCAELSAFRFCLLSVYITSTIESMDSAPASFQSLNVFPVNCEFYEMLSASKQTTWLSFWNYFPFNFLRVGYLLKTQCK